MIQYEFCKPCQIEVSLQQLISPFHRLKLWHCSWIHREVSPPKMEGCSSPYPSPKMTRKSLFFSSVNHEFKATLDDPQLQHVLEHWWTIRVVPRHLWFGCWMTITTLRPHRFIHSEPTVQGLNFQSSGLPLVHGMRIPTPVNGPRSHPWCLHVGMQLHWPKIPSECL